MVNNYFLKIKFEDFSLTVITGPADKVASLNSPSHYHLTNEIHIVKNGRMRIRDEDSEYTVKGGELAVIPPRCPHSVDNYEAGTEKIAFSVTLMGKDAKSGLYKQVSELLSCNKIKIIEFTDIPELSEIIKISNSTLSYTRKETEYLLRSYFTILFLKLAVTSDLPTQNMLQSNYDESIFSYIADNYASQITVSDLARFLNLSVRHTEKIIRQRLNSTFTTVLNEHRIRIAKELLADRADYSLEEIAYRVGYISYSYFYKQFVKHTGKSPSEYKRG